MQWHGCGTEAVCADVRTVWGSGLAWATKNTLLQILHVYHQRKASNPWILTFNESNWPVLRRKCFSPESFKTNLHCADSTTVSQYRLWILHKTPKDNEWTVKSISGASHVLEYITACIYLSVTVCQHEARPSSVCAAATPSRDHLSLTLSWHETEESRNIQAEESEMTTTQTHLRSQTFSVAVHKLIFAWWWF